MKQIKTALFIAVFLFGASLAKAKDAKLNIEKSNATSGDIKNLANSAEEESSAVAKSMQHIFDSSSQGDDSKADSKDVMEYVDAEMKHQDPSATASHKPAEEEKEKRETN